MRSVTNRMNTTKLNLTARTLPAILSLCASPLIAGPQAPATSASTPVTADAPAPGGRPCICQGADSSVGDAPFSGSVRLSYDSAFFCRGMDMGDNVLSGWLDLNVRLTDDLVWATTARYLDVEETDFRESHLYTGLFYRVGQVSFGPSFRWYHNFEGGMMEDAYDIGLQTLVNAGPLDITAGYFYETESEGHFWEVGVSSTIKVHDRVSLVPAAEIGYTDGWMMPPLQGWNHVALRLSAVVSLAENVTLTPWIGANLPLEALDDGQDDKLVGGVSLALRF